MSWSRRVFRIFDAKPDVPREVQEELAFHLEMRTREFMDSGMGRAEAERAARDSFGDEPRIEALCRRISEGRERERARRDWLNGLALDARYAARSLRASPGFTAVAVLTLALGIGGMSAVFSVVDSVILQPLPYQDAEELVAVRETAQGSSWWSTSPGTFRDWERGNRTLEGLAFVYAQSFSLLDGGEPERVAAARVSADFLMVLGARPALGRGFRPGEDVPGAEPVAILSHDYWRRRFGGDPAVIGRRLSLDGTLHTVIGVMPDRFSFAFLDDGELLVPRAFDPDTWAGRGRFLRAIARLRDGTSLAAAQADMDRVARDIAEENPTQMGGWGAELRPLHEEIVGDARAPLWTLFGAVAFVLLIACANLSNLMLIRGSVRQRELALKLAMGSGRWRVIRQLLLEATLLALVGGVVGLTLAVWATDGMLGLAAEGLPRLEELTVDLRVLGFTAAVSTLVGLAVGFVPSLRLSRVSPSRTLSVAGVRATAGRGETRLRGVFVALQVGLVLVLSVGAGLMLKSFDALRRVDPGFQLEGRIAAEINASNSRYPDRVAVNAFYRELLERLNADPRVRAAGLVTNLPLTGDGFSGYIIVEGGPAVDPGDEPIGGMEAVSPDYFRALGIPLLQGRSFDLRDHGEAPPVAVINDELAARHFPGVNPVGRRIRLARNGPGSTPREIVGVVASVKYGLDVEVRPRIYIPSEQLFFGARRHLVVWTRRPAASYLVDLREAVWQVDGEQALAWISPLDDVLSDSIARPRLQTVLLAGFALVGLMLGAIGVYGVVAYTVAQRSREMGVRLALGARGGEVVRWVMARAAVPVLVGLAAGMIASLALTRLMSGLLYGVSARDPATYLAILMVMIAVASAAIYLPARRAARVDPVVTLRAE